MAIAAGKLRNGDAPQGRSAGWMRCIAKILPTRMNVATKGHRVIITAPELVPQICEAAEQARGA
jgi:hypothetical protein